MRAITSWSPEGYEVYGKGFLETWLEHVDIPLIVYTERYQELPVEQRSLWEIPGCVEFVREAMATDNYRFNSKKFARKAFAQMDAMKEGGTVLWFDADVVFSDKLTKEYIEHRLGPYISYMAREQFYPCSSFVAWNTEHEDHPKFLAEYERLYYGRGLYKEKEWHDAFILDVAIQRTGVNAKNLCKSFPNAVRSANVFDMVFPMGHHKKGPRKFGEKGG